MVLVKESSIRIDPPGAAALPARQKGLEGKRYFYNMPSTVRRLSLSNWAFPGHSRMNQTRNPLPVDPTISCIVIFDFFRLDLCLLQPSNSEIVWKLL